MPPHPPATDFLISCSSEERQWGQWIAWELEAAGFRVRLWCRDMLPGENFVLWTGQQLTATRFMIAMYSPAYFQSGRCMSELSAALRRGSLLPFRVAHCQPPELLGVTAYETLFGLTEQAARHRLLRGARAALDTSSSPAAAPAGGGNVRRPRFPGNSRPVRKLPARNAWFVGRDLPLATLEEKFRSADPHRLTAVALTGVAGAGKTQLASEFAYRFGSAYSLVWWLPAATPEAFVDALGGLADVLGLPDDRDHARRARRALSALSEHPAWLLVFDDVRRPQLVAEWLPDGNGHVLMTGRSRALGDFGTNLEIGHFAPEESVTLLRGRASHLGAGDADRIAQALGHLPLAIGQAGAFLDTTKLTAAAYLALLRDAASEALSHGPADYPTGLVGAITTAMDLLRERDATAAGVLLDAAFLAPEPLPPVVLQALVDTTSETHPAEPPGVVAAVLRGVEGSGLAGVDAGTFQVHRLTQAVIRDVLEEGDRDRIAERVRARLAAATPPIPAEPTAWPLYAALAVHLLALLDSSRIVPDGGPRFRAAVLNLARYLTQSGQYGSALACAGRAVDLWCAHHGEDHRDVLAAAYCLAEAQRASGRFAQAERLDRATYERRRRTLGRSHRETLLSAAALAADQWGLGRRREALRSHSRSYRAARRSWGPDDEQTLELASNLALGLYGLGRTDAARALDEQTLARRQKLLGEEHPATLTSARNLAHDLRKLDARQHAMDLDRWTYAVSRRVLGADHPDTLLVASSLAVDYYASGDYRTARDLHEETLYRSRRVLGPDHPNTLRVANSLGLDLYRLGDVTTAHQLHLDTLHRLARTLGPDHPTTLHAAHNLARDAHALGRRDEARTLWSDTLRRRRRVLGARHPETRRTERKIRET